MKISFIKLATVSALVLLMAQASFGAAPDNTKKKNFEKKHPRRAEVLRRDKREVGKNNAAVKSGKITAAQGAKLNQQDAKIKSQEQAEAKANGGHITKGEQRQLNREENKVNRERRHDERKDASAPNVPVTAPAAPAAAAVPTSH